MSVELFEVIDLKEGAGRVDREAGLIRGVKLLGWKSANGRTYDPAGVNPSLYEGRVVNCNHAKSGQERDVRDRIGRTVNVVKKRDGLYGDLEILRSHPVAGAVFEAAERMPGLFGLSHTARGRERQGSRGAVIEAVQSVQSVDLVGDPATVAGLYESRRTKVAKVKVTDLYEQLKGTRPLYAKALQEMAEAGVMSPGAMMDPPAGEASGTDHKQALRDACKAVLDDESLSEEEMVAKIKKILKIINGGSKGDGPPVGDDDSADDEAPAETEESKKDRAELAQLRVEKRVRTAAEKAGVRVTTALLESIRPDITDEQIKALLADRAGAPAGRPGARSATPPAPEKGKGKATDVRESRTAETVPDDRASAGKWLSGR